jgi:hypothetical protein
MYIYENKRQFRRFRIPYTSAGFRVAKRVNGIDSSDPSS